MRSAEIDLFGVDAAPAPLMMAEVLNRTFDLAI